jgi:hypothetical protein
VIPLYGTIGKPHMVVVIEELKLLIGRFVEHTTLRRKNVRVPIRDQGREKSLPNSRFATLKRTSWYRCCNSLCRRLRGLCANMKLGFQGQRHREMQAFLMHSRPAWRASCRCRPRQLPKCARYISLVSRHLKTSRSLCTGLHVRVERTSR